MNSKDSSRLEARKGEENGVCLKIKSQLYLFELHLEARLLIADLSFRFVERFVFELLLHISI